MKNIKVRLWDGSRMIYRELTDRNWYTDDTQKGKLITEARPKDAHRPIMLFTGIKDYDGKNIYAEDIIEHEEAPGYIRKGIVLWEPDRLLFVIDFKGKGRPYYNFWYVTAEVIRVIGNLYESPGLMDCVAED